MRREILKSNFSPDSSRETPVERLQSTVESREPACSAVKLQRQAPPRPADNLSQSLFRDLRAHGPQQAEVAAEGQGVKVCGTSTRLVVERGQQRKERLWLSH